MTNEQLYLAIGIPALLILVNTSMMLFLFNRVEGRLDKMQTDIDGRFNRMQTDIDGRFNRMQADIDGRFAKIDTDLRRFFELFGRHDKSIELLERKI